MNGTHPSEVDATVVVNIIANSPVTEIRCVKALRRSNLATSDKSVQVTSLDKVQAFDFIAVAVPLASLKSGNIRFTGDCEASIEKQNAISCTDEV